MLYNNNYQKSGNFTREMDGEDPLLEFREKFYIPEKDGRRVIYFCGNSLGLQPVSVKEYVDRELEIWKTMAVGGHFKGDTPWFQYNKLLKPGLASLLGASEDTVTPMASLTANLHLLLVSFYRPNKKRFKILTEASAFPSDYYALESQIRYHGYDPADAIIEIEPKEGENYISLAMAIL